jgi:hypothetical protein
MGSSGAAAVVTPVLRANPPGTTSSFAGQPVNTSLSVTGGSAPFTWTVSGLPAGLTGDASGHITGTPGSTSATLFIVSATVTDAVGRQASTAFFWTNLTRVPGVVGQSQSAATSVLTNAGFVVSVSRTMACVNPGEVLSQSPDEGVGAAGGSTVHITVDSGTLKSCRVIL